MFLVYKGKTPLTMYAKSQDQNCIKRHGCVDRGSTNLRPLGKSTRGQDRTTRIKNPGRAYQKVTKYHFQNSKPYGSKHTERGTMDRPGGARYELTIYQP